MILLLRINGVEEHPVARHCSWASSGTRSTGSTGGGGGGVVVFCYYFVHCVVCRKCIYDARLNAT